MISQKKYIWKMKFEKYNVFFCKNIILKNNLTTLEIYRTAKSKHPTFQKIHIQKQIDKNIDVFFYSLFCITFDVLSRS